MPGSPSRSIAGITVGLCLIAAAPARAHDMKFRHAQVEPLTFAALDGWKDDDQVAAFATYLQELRRHPARQQGDAQSAAGVRRAL